MDMDRRVSDLKEATINTLMVGGGGGGGIVDATLPKRFFQFFSGMPEELFPNQFFVVGSFLGHLPGP